MAKGAVSSIRCCSFSPFIHPTIPFFVLFLWCVPLLLFPLLALVPVLLHVVSLLLPILNWGSCASQEPPIRPQTHIA
uniref:Uncharacterized protein n=1 Tax=Anguilla anguilla TaxID=7936 RepID=A0A0E9UEY7_ANGAN